MVKHKVIIYCISPIFQFIIHQRMVNHIKYNTIQCQIIYSKVRKKERDVAFMLLWDHARSRWLISREKIFTGCRTLCFRASVVDTNLCMITNGTLIHGKGYQVKRYWQDFTFTSSFCWTTEVGINTSLPFLFFNLCFPHVRVFTRTRPIQLNKLH